MPSRGHAYRFSRTKIQRLVHSAKTQYPCRTPDRSKKSHPRGADARSHTELIGGCRQLQLPCACPARQRFMNTTTFDVGLNRPARIFLCYHAMKTASLVELGTDFPYRISIRACDRRADRHPREHLYAAASSTSASLGTRRPRCEHCYPS